MRARVVAPARGAQWIFEGCRVFIMAPFTWLALAFAFFIATMVLSSLPGVGTLVCLLIYPTVIAVFMLVSRTVALRQPLDSRLFGGVSARLRPLLVLGGAYAVGVVLAFLGSSLADDGALLRALSRSPPPGETALPMANAREGFAMAMLLYLPTFMAVLYSPLLIVWHNMPPAKAIFYSFTASLLNWKALIVYIFVGGLLAVLASNLVFALAFALAGAQARSNPDGFFVAVALSLFILALPTVMASTYASYRDVFAAPVEP